MEAKERVEKISRGVRKRRKIVERGEFESITKFERLAAEQCKFLFTT